MRPCGPETRSSCGAAVDRCGGDLLPEDLYDEWAGGPRQRVRQLRTDLLRRLGRWDDLVQLDGTDEEAHLELMRALAARGDRHGALRQFERLDRALAGELGVAPEQGGGRAARRPPGRRGGRARTRSGG